MSNNIPIKREGFAGRERWSSRPAFYSATIGAAVGFTNVWRFPALVYEYGGGAFFIPYLLALFFIGLPILILEIAFGQYYETGDVEVFGGISKRLRGVGLSSIACGYMVVTSYSMLMSWVSHAFFDSFGHENFWKNEVTGSEAKDYFHAFIVGDSTVDPDDPKPTRIVWKNVGCSLLTWTVIYLCIVSGIKKMGRITYFTMGFPVVVLLILLGIAVSLEGSQEGIQEYLSSDWGVLTRQPEVWPKAVTETLFSMGITFGVMTAYGSHCKRNEPALVNSLAIAASDSLISIVAGLAVFATLGHLAYRENTTIQDLHLHGVGLIFGSWPVVLGSLPGGEHWIRLFFLMIFSFELNSAFAFMEGILVSLGDTTLLSRFGRKYTALGLSLLAWLLSFLYATDAGLIFFDTIDYYIQFAMLLVALAQCFAAGWIYNIDEQIDNLGSSIVFSFMATYFGAVFFASVLWFSMTDANTAIVAGFAALIVIKVVGMSTVCYFMHKRMKECPGIWSWRSMFYDLMFRNMMDLRDDLSGVVGYIPTLWAGLIKFFIPPILLVLFFMGCAAKNVNGQPEFGHYYGYPTLPYQVLGIMTVVFAGFIFVSSLIVPQMYNAFHKTNSPIPSKEATIHAAPCDTDKDKGAVTLSLDTQQVRSVWPPESIQVPV